MVTMIRVGTFSHGKVFVWESWTAIAFAGFAFAGWVACIAWGVHQWNALDPISAYQLGLAKNNKDAKACAEKAKAADRANAARDTAAPGASAADHAAALGEIAREQAQLMQRMQVQMMALENALRQQQHQQQPVWDQQQPVWDADSDQPRVLV